MRRTQPLYVRPLNIAETAEMQAKLSRGFLGYGAQLSPALRAELDKLTMAPPKMAGSK